MKAEKKIWDYSAFTLSKSPLLATLTASKCVELAKPFIDRCVNECKHKGEKPFIRNSWKNEFITVYNQAVLLKAESEG